MKSLTFLLLLLALPALADQEVEQRIADKLSQARPDLEYGKAQATAVDGIYQVQVKDGPVLYVTADGEHMFVGELYRIAPGQFVSVTELERTRMRRSELARLDTADMIVFPAKGETRGILNVFTDVDCGYCRKLHQEVPTLNDNGVEVRYLAFPRAGADSEVARRMAMAWCAGDPRQALTDLKAGKTIEGEVCDDNPVAEQYRLGLDFGVTGTPALVLMDGTLLPGYKPAADLLTLFGIE